MRYCAMLAMRYGTVPIVRETGGLSDSVIPYNRYTNEGIGFSFANYNAHEMLYTIENAIGLYYDKLVWNGLVKRAMQRISAGMLQRKSIWGCIKS